MKVIQYKPSRMSTLTGHRIPNEELAFFEIIPELLRNQKDGFSLSILKPCGKELKEEFSAFCSENELRRRIIEIENSVIYLVSVKTENQSLISFRGQKYVISFTKKEGLIKLEYFSHSEFNEDEKSPTLKDENSRVYS